MMSRTLSKGTEGLAGRLKEAREMRGLTQAELGLRAGMAPASVSHFETSQRVPSLDSLVKLADGLEVSTDLLLGRAGAQNAAHVDPVFLRASRSNARTLDLVRRVTEALIDEGHQPPE